MRMTQIRSMPYPRIHAPLPARAIVKLDSKELDLSSYNVSLFVCHPPPGSRQRSRAFVCIRRKAEQSDEEETLETKPKEMPRKPVKA